MNDFHVFDLASALFETPTPQPEMYLEVRLQFNDSQVVETVNFKSLNVFNFIADSVTVLRWKYISELDGQKDILTEGDNLESMTQYFADLERQEKLNAKQRR